MTDSEVNVLMNLGLAAKAIKKKISSGYFNTDRQIIEHLKQYCKNNSWEFSFPPLLAKDTIISHVAIQEDKPNFLNDCKIYTIDFGFIDKKTKLIIDNSITVCNDKSLEKYVSLYDTNMAKIHLEAQKFLKNNSFITIEYLTHLMDKTFNPFKKKLEIVPFAGSHTILKNKLHDEVIPCTNTNTNFKDCNFKYELKSRHTKLKNGTVFTLEPHVLIIDNLNFEKSNILKAETSNQENKKSITLRTKYEFFESNIVFLKKRNKYVLKKEAQALEIPENQYITQKGFKTNNLSFFNEDCYVIWRNNLIKIT